MPVGVEPSHPDRRVVAEEVPLGLPGQVGLPGHGIGEHVRIDGAARVRDVARADHRVGGGRRERADRRHGRRGVDAEPAVRRVLAVLRHLHRVVPHPTGADEADRRRPELLRVTARGGAVALVAVDAPRDGGEGVVEVADVAVPVGLGALVLDPRGPRRGIGRPRRGQVGTALVGRVRGRHRAEAGQRRVGEAPGPRHPRLEPAVGGRGGPWCGDEDGGQQRHHERAPVRIEARACRVTRLPSAPRRRRGAFYANRAALFDAVPDGISYSMPCPMASAIRCRAPARSG